jgi:hypothetical protein
MPTTNGERSFFARYIDEPPKKEQPTVTIQKGPLLPPTVPPTDSKSPPIEQLLDFLINHWSEPTINARTIHWRGPNCTRNRKSVIELAEALVAAGWLCPVKPRRRDMRVWKIVRGPSR